MAVLPPDSETTIGELIQSGLCGQFGEFIFTYMTPDHWQNKLSSYGYDKVGFAPGLRRLKELASRSKSLHFQIYPETERLASWDKATVWLEFFPALKSDKPLPYILILPGGGYNRQWGFIEGQAIAARANELGFPAFVLFYRVKQEPLMPLPIEDLYHAVQFIGNHAGVFGVDPDRYMLGGFSAGASIAGCTLTKGFSWEVGGIPKPAAVFLGYAPTRFDEFYKLWKDSPQGSPEHEGTGAVLRRVGGTAFTMESLSVYDIPSNLNPDIPPVYITANLDDPVVPVANSLALMEALKQRGAEYKARIGKTGGHSYGLGYGLEVAGWFDEAVALFSSRLTD